MSHSKECIADARANGLHLVRLAINGRHAKRASMELCASVGPKTAERLKAIFADLCDTKKRMQ